jgi:predicted secreted protein
VRTRLMVTFMIAALAAGVVVAGPMAPVASAQSYKGDEVLITSFDKGRTVTMRPGMTLRVQLYQQPARGYSWRLVDAGGGVLRLTEQDVVRRGSDDRRRSDDRRGSDDRRRLVADEFTFRALRAGRADLRFAYVNGRRVADQWAVTVHVNPGFFSGNQPRPMPPVRVDPAPQPRPMPPAPYGTPPWTQGRTIVVTEAHNGGIVQMRVGDVLRLQLTARGETWRVVQSDEFLLRQFDSSFLPPGMHAISFQAVNPGTVGLAVRNTAAFAAGTFRITVRITY